MFDDLGRDIIGRRVKYLGCSDAQHIYSKGNADVRNYCVIGNEYTIKDAYIGNSSTIYELEGCLGKFFNSVCFEMIDTITKVSPGQVYSVSIDGFPKKNCPVLWIQKNSQVYAGWLCDNVEYPFAFMDDEMFENADALELATKFNAFSDARASEMKYVYLDEFELGN